MTSSGAGRHLRLTGCLGAGKEQMPHSLWEASYLQLVSLDTSSTAPPKHGLHTNMGSLRGQKTGDTNQMVAAINQRSRIEGAPRVRTGQVSVAFLLMPYAFKKLRQPLIARCVASRDPSLFKSGGALLHTCRAAGARASAQPPCSSQEPPEACRSPAQAGPRPPPPSSLQPSRRPNRCSKCSRCRLRWRPTPPWPPSLLPSRCEWAAQALLPPGNPCSLVP